MESFELLEQIASALATDQELESWCAEHLGSLPGVWIGINAMNPPREDSYPLIAITDIKVSGEAIRGEKKLEVDVACGVVEAQKKEQGRIIAHTGMVMAEKFRAAVRDALFRAWLGKITTHGDAGQIEAHPIYISGMAVDITVKIPQRRV